MGFLTKAFRGPDNSAIIAQQQAQQVEQTKRVDEARAAAAEQKAVVDAQEAKTAAAERAQRAVRSGSRRGLLAYVDDTSGDKLGG